MTHAYVHNALCMVKSKCTDDPVHSAQMDFDSRPDPAKRLEQARLSKGIKSAREAAQRFGWKYDSYIQHENGTRGLIRSADRYAKAYGVSPAWLLTGEGTGPDIEAASSGTVSTSTRANASFPPRFERFPQGESVPLLGQTAGGPNGRFFLNGSEIDRVFCPPNLIGVEGAYAVKFYGTSMEPRFKAGETGWINPREPVRAGDDVVVQLLTDEENVVETYVKEFVSQSARVLRLFQHNPDEGETHELEFPAQRVFSVHKIVFHAAL